MSASALAFRPLVYMPARSAAPPPVAPRPRARPRVPEDFFSAEAQRALAHLLTTRAARWQADSQPPLYFYGEHSAPLWGDDARRRCSGKALRSANYHRLCESLSLDLERCLRLLTLAWANAGTTADGHTSTEWRAALAGVLWRVGQHYRELARRKGDAGAQAILCLAMGALWG